MRNSAVLIFALSLAATAQTRHLTFNGRLLTPEQMQRLERVERMYGVRLPDKDFWYDNRSGAAGLWNGPGLAALPPGLQLGGPMPAHCSGGGTGVCFRNWGPCIADATGWKQTDISALRAGPRWATFSRWRTLAGNEARGSTGFTRPESFRG